MAWTPEKDFEQISTIIKKINDEVGIEVNCSLGFINQDMAIELKKLGVTKTVLYAAFQLPEQRKIGCLCSSASAVVHLAGLPSKTCIP